MKRTMQHAMTQRYIAAAALAMLATMPAGAQATPAQQPQAGPYDALAEAVAKATAGQASAKALILEFAKFVEAHKDDPVALQAYVDSLNSGSDDLAAAVVANPDPDPAN